MGQGLHIDQGLLRRLRSEQALGHSMSATSKTKHGVEEGSPPWPVSLVINRLGNIIDDLV